MAGYRRGLRLPGSVVAVTGAAGGTGRAVALALAGRGARPVLVDRDAPGLDRLADACAARGVTALPTAADVTDPAAVRAAAAAAVDRFGHLDGWVDCAVTTLGGALLDLPEADLRRVLEADLLGPLYGARAALPHMIAQRHGVLVVVSSVHAQVALPFGAAAGMARAATRVMAAALRQELRLSGVRGVAVTAVLAPSTGTPLHPPTGTDTDPDVGRDAEPVRPPPPTYPAERVAATVLRQLRRPRLEVVAGGPRAKALVHGHALVPALSEWVVAQAVRRRGAQGG